MQIVLGCVLSVAVIAFEIDMRLHGGWRQIVGKRDLPAEQWETVARILYVHLVFAISTPLLWFATLVLALRHFSSPPLPGRHSRWHRRLGWLSTLDITLTSVTGLMFYYAAFVM